MEMSWSTFVFEIINFLVLVWILKHFLYKPVLEVIAQRKSGIEKSMNAARELHQDAEQLQHQYEGRLADWDKERRQIRATLEQELDEERSRKIEELKQALEQEQQKAEVAETRRINDLRTRIEETALQQSARFASRLLELGSGPETEARLIEILIQDLEQLTPERITELRTGYGSDLEEAIVASAYTLGKEQQQNLRDALAKITPAELPVRFEVKPDLLAGVRITIGAWVLGTNLQDELKGFMAFAHEH